MHRLRTYVTVLVCSLTIAACGSSGSNDGGSGKNGPPDAETFVKRVLNLSARAGCQQLLKCDKRPPDEVAFSTMDACLSSSRGEFSDRLLTGFREASERGRISYNPEKAQTCLSKLEKLVSSGPCATLADLSTDACNEALKGTVSKGEPCLFELGTCKPNLTCRPGENGCYGRCKAVNFVGEGESCNLSEGPRCDPRTNLNCAPKANGTDGRVCIPRESRSKGEPCSFESDCKLGLACARGVCRPFEVVGNGKSCDQERVYCKPGLACHGEGRENGEPTGTCGEFPQKGDSCSPGDCGGDLYCSSEGTCQPPKTKGDSCSSDDECGSGLSCGKPKDGKAVCEKQPTNPYEACQLPE
ncbi:MAG: hypothetical protein ABEL76_16870 [Bradymonadaceae bacterium]